MISCVSGTVNIRTGNGTQYSRITAPADGVLGLRKVDEGNMVHASDTEGLFVIFNFQILIDISTLFFNYY